MFIADLCNPAISPSQRRNSFHKRKLEVLSIYRDSLERRIAAINASIQTLEDQINRDSMQSD